MNDDYLTVLEAASYLGVSRDKITRMIRAGELTVIPNQIDKRERLISRKQLDKLKPTPLRAEPRIRLRPADDAELRASIAESDLEDQEGIVITIEEIEEMVSRKIAEKMAAKRASA
jgi:excisionase family DNA binding protein